MSELEDIKKLHNEGQLEAAITGYQKIIANEPNNDEAHFGLAHAYSRTNQHELSLKHAEEAVKLSPNTDRYLQFKGQMLLANNKPDAALKAFKRSIKENPNLFYSYLAIADIHTLKKESKKAKDNYNLALKVHADGIPAVVRLARLMILESDYTGAENLLNRYELQFPAEPNLKLHMGILRLEQGQDGFAELYFKKLLENEPNNHVARAYLSISQLDSDPDQAIKTITEMAEQRIQIPEMMVALGMMYAKIQNYPEAIRHLQLVCQSGAAYPSWLIALAHAFFGNGQPNSAQTALQTVLERGENSRALLILGQIHQSNKNYPTAIKIYQRVAKDSPDFEQAIIQQAECAYDTAEYEQVITQLNPVLTKQSDHNIAISLKLKALAQLHRYDEALALIGNIDKDKQLDSFNQLMHQYAGLLFDANQNYDQAWQHFSQIELPKPNLVELLSDDDEKRVQTFATKPAESLFHFVFTDPATGHHDFINWLSKNGVTPLTDRFSNKGRKDVFSETWSVEHLAKLNETKIHFLRKKYIKQLNLLIDNDTTSIADLMPLSPINLAVITRIFPNARILLLSRNFADLRLHNRVFGSYRVNYSQFSKVSNQMVAMNPNLSVIDIDAWQSGDDSVLNSIKDLFGQHVTPFKFHADSPLDRTIFPYLHWKNYQQQLNQ